jgi:hypothetical protein
MFFSFGAQIFNINVSIKCEFHPELPHLHPAITALAGFSSVVGGTIWDRRAGILVGMINSPYSTRDPHLEFAGDFHKSCISDMHCSN